MTPLSPMHAATSAHLEVIRQGLTLLAEIGAERYTARVPLCFNSSIGGHIRHIIEHYQSFLLGLPTGEIDYENRPRDARVEANPLYAVAILEAIAVEMQGPAATSTNRELRLRAETTPGRTTDTSVLRELEFLLSHTVHHYALIATMARLQSHKPEASFGMAPSTLRYLQAQASCVR